MNLFQLIVVSHGQYSLFPPKPKIGNRYASSMTRTLLAVCSLDDIAMPISTTVSASLALADSASNQPLSDEWVPYITGGATAAPPRFDLHGRPIHLQLWFLLFRRQHKLDNQLRVAICLLSKPNKGRSQLFKFRTHLGITCTICLDEQFKRFCPVSIPRGHRLPFVGRMSFYTSA